MTNILVTGASGFLGTHLMARLRSLGYDPYGVFSQTYDLRREAHVEALFKHVGKVDVLYHLAAIVGGIGANSAHPGLFFYDNMKMGLNIVHGAMAHGVGKVVVVGTTCLSGDEFVRIGHTRYTEIGKIRDNHVIGTTCDGVTHSSIVKFFERDYSGNIIKIKPYTCEEIITTPEHPFLVKKTEVMGWVNARDLRDTDLLVFKIPQRPKIQDEVKVFIDEIDSSYPVSNLPNKKRNIPSQIVIDKELAWFMGVFVAEGYTSANRGHSFFAFGNEPEAIDRVRKILQERFDLDSTLEDLPGQEGYRVHFYSKQLGQWLSNFYNSETHNAHHKIVPWDVFRCNDDIIKSFIRGCFDGDGHIAYRSYVTGKYINTALYTSVSRELIYQVRDLLLWLGIVSSIHRGDPTVSEINGREIIGGGSYFIKISGQNLDKFIEYVYPELLSDLHPNRRKSRYEVEIDGDYIYLPILSLSSEYGTLPVYNIETGSETYTANGIIVHNCSYPKFAPIPFREHSLFDGYPEETNAPYGIAKRALYTMLKAYQDEYGLRFAYLIPTNLYGPGDKFDDATSHVIPALIKKCLKAKCDNAPEIEVWGTGRATRDFLYVEDCAEAIALAGENYDNYQPLNLGSGNEISIEVLMDLIMKATGYKGRIRYDTSKPDGQPRRKLDTKAAKAALGWEATTGLKDGLKSTVEWYETINQKASNCIF